MAFLKSELFTGLKSKAVLRAIVTDVALEGIGTSRIFAIQHNINISLSIQYLNNIFHQWVLNSASKAPDFV